MNENETCYLCGCRLYDSYDTRILVLSSHKHRVCKMCAEKLKCRPFEYKPYTTHKNAVFNGECD